MTQQKRPETIPEKNKEGQPSADPDREKARVKTKQKLKFYGVVAVMVIFCAGFIWFVFKPDKSKEEISSGINLEIPDGTLPQTESDKRKALEIAEMQDRQRDKVRSLLDFGDELAAVREEQQAVQKEPEDPISRSANSARQITQQLQTFYDEPREDPELSQLRKQVAELSAQLQSQPAHQPVDEIALMEKSYELAAKYMQQGGQQTSPVRAATETEVRQGPVESVRRAAESETSSLAELELTAQERNYGFLTAEGSEPVAMSNAIRACVADDQVITVGTMVRLRLLEPLKVAGYYIPVNTNIYGIAQVQGQRIGVVVSSIESEGNIVPVELTVHDMDGQRGINVPNTLERSAAKEALASMGQSFGTSISVAQSAGQQVAMDLTRGVMSGGSQYLSSKMREVKITLKAGYQLLLIAK